MDADALARLEALDDFEDDDEDIQEEEDVYNGDRDDADDVE